jgi:cytochrome c oxidase subunit 2|tara:strand:- start:1549 stop:2337 length:789 start_codon:yes stop_codon:yes gene_type:complete
MLNALTFSKLGLFSILGSTAQDSSEAWQTGFQDAATPVMEGIINLHHDLMFFIVFICFFVMWMLGRASYLFDSSRNPVASNTVHGTTIEIVWTVVPSLILVVVSLPSFALLYSIDEMVNPVITIKCIGHQWYWSYEYSDYSQPDQESIAFDSYMVPEEDLEEGQLRLLEVDNRIVLPVKTHIRVLVSAADVLHSWAIPSLGVKMDACPGRLNQTSMFINREGVYYGQCSEICGVNHGFMPIVVEAVSTEKYVSWIANKIEEA